jgi:phosphoribosylpyrophosphate synthetase
MSEEAPAGKRARTQSLDGGSGKSWQYNVLAWKSCVEFAERLQEAEPDRFTYLPTIWNKFDDSKMDHIIVGGFQPRNVIARSHVLFLAAFDDNDAIMSQMHVLFMLCESFMKTLTIVLPYYPVATMERVVLEGEIATANTLSRMLSSLPRVASPARVMLYDLHTLQNRFYFHSSAIATMHTGIPLIKARILEPCAGGHRITAVAFPDEGAQKRFGKMFPRYPTVLCGKTRVGETRQVVVQDGDPRGQHVLVVDDVVKTGGTLAECAKTLSAAGALTISAYCTHAGFPAGAAERFCAGGDRAVFEHFWLTNSNPVPVAHLRTLDAAASPFEVLDLMPLVVKDLAQW